MAACDSCGCRFSEPEDEMGDHPCPRCGAQPDDDAHTEQEEPVNEAIITRDEIELINQTRDLLDAIRERLSTRHYNAPNIRAFAMGEVAAETKEAGEALFGVICGIKTWRMADVTDADLYRTDREPVAA